MNTIDREKLMAYIESRIESSRFLKNKEDGLSYRDAVIFSEYRSLREKLTGGYFDLNQGSTPLNCKE